MYSLAAAAAAAAVVVEILEFRHHSNSRMEVLAVLAPDNLRAELASAEYKRKVQLPQNPNSQSTCRLLCESLRNYYVT